MIVGDVVKVIGEATDGFIEFDGHYYFIAGMGGWVGRIIGFIPIAPLNNFTVLVKFEESVDDAVTVERLRSVSPGLEAYFRPTNLRVVSPLDLIAEV